MDNSEFLKQMNSNFDNLDDSLDDLDSVIVDSGDIVEEHVVDTGAFDNSLSLFDELESFDDSEDDFSQSTVIPESLSSIAIPLNFDIDDLNQDVGSTQLATEQSFDDIETKPAFLEEVQSKIIPICEQRGYHIDNPDNLELVNATCGYITLTQEDPAALPGEYQTSYSYMVGLLTSTSALYIDQRSSLNKFKMNAMKLNHDPELKDACSVALGQVCTMISAAQRKAADEGKSLNDVRVNDVNTSQIFSGLLTNPNLSKVYVMTHEEEMQSFIASATAAMLSAQQDSEVRESQSASRKEATSRIITHDVYDMIEFVQSNPISYIRRIDSTNGGDLVCTCGACGAKTKAVSLMNFIFFNESREIHRGSYPTKNICSGCGAMLMFPPKLYDVACNYYYENNKDLIQQDLDKAKLFGPGFSVICMTPSINQLPLQISCIIHDSDVNQLTTTAINEGVEFFDDNEWNMAVKDFYTHIDLLRNKSEASKFLQSGDTVEVARRDENGEVITGMNLSLADTEMNYSIEMPPASRHDGKFIAAIAAVVAQVAGVDYNIAKSKALVSLITYLQSNHVLGDMMNFDKVMSANASLRLATNYANSDNIDFNTLDSGTFGNLMIIAAKIDPTVQDPSDRNELKGFLKTHVSELERYAESVNSQYRKFITSLETAKYALSVLPIVDYKQTSVYSIMQFLVNEQIFNVVSEICDRMILNTYAEKYFDYWCRCNFEHTPNLRNKLLSSADTKLIGNAIQQVFKDVFSQYGVANSACYFPNAMVQSTDKWEILKHLSELANTGNYYRFCVEALQVEDTDYGFGPEFNLAMRDFFSINFAEFQRVTSVSEVQYYLGQMFSLDELESAKDETPFLVFSRYIPRRLENESIHDYIKRFKSAEISQSLDNKKKFDALANLQFVYFGSVIMEARHSNFRVASFVSGMLDSVINSESSDAFGLIGASKTNYSSAISKIQLWTFSDFNVNNGDAIALLNGYYFTDVDVAMSDTFSEMSTCYFQASSKLTPLVSVFDFDAHLAGNLQSVSSNPELSDMLSMVNEMATWELTKGYSERFSNV